MEITHYIALDLEHGGTQQGSILSLALEVTDSRFRSLGTLSLDLKPNDGHYRVTAGSLEVTKLNLVEHEKTAITCSKAGQVLREFLVQHSQGGKVKLTPVGHGIEGDLRLISEQVLGETTLYMYLSYLALDTGVITRYLQALPNPKIPPTQPCTLSSLVEYFNLGDFKFHTALGDAQATLKLLERLLNL
jgi:hypothetical protein